MNQEEFEKKKEDAQVYQAKMMAIFKQSETYVFIKNLLELKRTAYAKDRQKAMRLASTRDNCLYFTGKEDAILEFIEAIDQAIINGEIIEANREFIRDQEG